MSDDLLHGWERRRVTLFQVGAGEGVRRRKREAQGVGGSEGVMSLNKLGR